MPNIDPFYRGAGVSLYSVPRNLTGPTTIGGITLTPYGAVSGVPGSAAGTLTGTSTGGSATAGGVPAVPDPAVTQAKVLQGNLQNLPYVFDLGGQANAWANEQARRALETNLPGYTANLGQESANVANLLAGRVSPETMANIGIAAAERGINVGTGSPNANAAMLRALGLTTESLQAQGAQQFAQMIAQTPIGKQFDYQAFLNLPSEEQQWQYLANVLKSSPDPAAAQFLDALMAMQGQRAGYGATNQPYGRKPSMYDMLPRTSSTPSVSYPIGGGGFQTTPTIAPAPAAPGWAQAIGPGGTVSHYTANAPLTQFEEDFMNADNPNYGPIAYPEPAPMIDTASLINYPSPWGFNPGGEQSLYPEEEFVY